MNRCAIPCSACGSTNTELRSSPPARGSLGSSLLDSIAGILPDFGSGSPLPGGQKYLVCKDCGHVAILMVN